MLQKLLSSFLIFCQLCLSPLQSFTRGAQDEEATGISTLSSQGLSSLIAHEGDVGAVLDDFGSSSFLKSLATHVMSAGLLQEMRLGTFGETFTSVDKPQAFLEHGHKALIQSVVQSGLKTALQGGSFESLMEDIGRETVAGALGGYAANHLHNLLPKIGFVPHKLLHGGLGAGMGAIFAKNPETGAISGMISGITAETAAELFHGMDLPKEVAGDLGEFAGPLTIYFTGSDIDASIFIAKNAIENNFYHGEDQEITQEEVDDWDPIAQWAWENREDVVLNLIPYGGTLKIAGQTGGKLVTSALSKVTKASSVQKVVHKNSLKYVGDTHVYVIRDKSSGKIIKYGESAMGKNKLGQSKRGEVQARKLTRKNPGKEFKSSIVKEYGSKAEARAIETKYIKTHRKVFGKDNPPLNKNNH